jgi:hypothetical protein
MRPAPKVVSSPLRRELLDEHGVEALDLLDVREVRGIVEEDEAALGDRLASAACGL